MDPSQEESVTPNQACIFMLALALDLSFFNKFPPYYTADGGLYPPLPRSEANRFKAPNKQNT